MRTRLDLGGYGSRRAGSFSGKGESAPHPVGRITQLQPGGYGGKRCTSFAGKNTNPTHPVGIITRLDVGGYGVRRLGSFAGKTPSVPLPPEPEYDRQGGGVPAQPIRIPFRQGVRKPTDSEIIAIVLSFLQIANK